MKKIVLASFLVLGFMLAGCQSSSYRWVKSDTGLPGDCKQVFNYKSMQIQYCLVPGSHAGEYYVEAIARSVGAHTDGRIAEGGFSLLLYKDKEIVYKTNLYRQGDDLDSAIYLRKTFEFDGEFDGAIFDWRLKYWY